MAEDPNKDIETRLKDLELKEARIETEEQQILSVDQHILNEVEKTRKNSKFSQAVYRFRFLISILLTIGIALVWQGVDKISGGLPLVSSAIGALVVGLLILALINWLTRAK